MNLILFAIYSIVIIFTIIVTVEIVTDYIKQELEEQAKASKLQRPL